ncbi:hypothetical protein ACLKOZ_16895 [Arthrobacter sp. R4]|uniref:hypothetical protein n=1 Tax=Arthrobacter sp. R4 TaxID=644417 RepID=UPI003EDA17F8
MSRRKYDHLRVRVNEEKRLLRAIKLYPSSPPTDDAIFGAISPQVAAIIDERHDRAVARRCSNGNCSIAWDPKRRQALYSMGPAGCCDE